jgi:hypothetical protein
MLELGNGSIHREQHLAHTAWAPGVRPERTVLAEGRFDVAVDLTLTEAVHHSRERWIPRYRVVDFEADRGGFRGRLRAEHEACVGLAFRELDAAEVWAIVRDTNLKSVNVAIRCCTEVRRRFTGPS